MRLRAGPVSMQNETSTWCSNDVVITHHGLAKGNKVTGVRRGHS